VPMFQKKLINKGPINSLPDGSPVPALAVSLGESGLHRFLDFFVVRIENGNTRKAYGRALGAFLRWCEARGASQFQDVNACHVAAYIHELEKTRSKQTVKQHLACIRMLFNWLIAGQVVQINPAPTLGELSADAAHQTTTRVRPI
jgi:integrase/recombinase XerD